MQVKKNERKHPREAKFTTGQQRGNQKQSAFAVRTPQQYNNN